MTRLAAAMACGLALVALLNGALWQYGAPTPIDLNLTNALGYVAGVVLAASVLGHSVSRRQHGDA